jgi:hypothetical protein
MAQLTSFDWDSLTSDQRDLARSWLQQAWDYLRRDLITSQNSDAIQAVMALIAQFMQLTSDSPAADVQASAQAYADLYAGAVADPVIGAFIHSAPPLQSAVPMAHSATTPHEVADLTRPAPSYWAALVNRATGVTPQHDALLPAGDDLRNAIGTWANEYDTSQRRDLIPDPWRTQRLKRLAWVANQRLTPLETTAAATAPTPEPNPRNTTTRPRAPHSTSVPQPPPSAPFPRRSQGGGSSAGSSDSVPQSIPLGQGQGGAQTESAGGGGWAGVAVVGAVAYFATRRRGSRR